MATGSSGSGHIIRAQAAIEYLVTHSWAILIIAVVLFALFSLGFFSQDFAPRATAGSCYILRPFGPGTTEEISLQGLCGSAEPKYVVALSGQTSGMNTPASSYLNVYGPNAMVTEVAWVEPLALNNFNGLRKSNLGVILFKYGQYELCIGANTLWMSDTNGDSATANILFSIGTWYQVAGTFSGATGNVVLYIDGAQQGSPIAVSWNAISTSGQAYVNKQLYIGVVTSGQIFCSNGVSFDGYISNIQLYNTSLSLTQMRELYEEGISGAPIVLPNIVGWWPLNGDINDYSGNGNNASQIGAIHYTYNWESGYSQP